MAEGDWSCEHGARWIGWTEGWMQVAAPMHLDEDENPVMDCECLPPGDEPAQDVLGNYFERRRGGA